MFLYLPFQCDSSIGSGVDLHRLGWGRVGQGWRIGLHWAGFQLGPRGFELQMDLSRLKIDRGRVGLALSCLGLGVDSACGWGSGSVGLGIELFEFVGVDKA